MFNLERVNKERKISKKIWVMFITALSHKKGQSLVEVTVALSILGITMVGLLTLAINVIGYSIGTKAKTQAVALAQEGLEIVRENVPACGGLSSPYYSIKTDSETGMPTGSIEGHDTGVPWWDDLSSRAGWPDNSNSIQRSISVTDASTAEVEVPPGWETSFQKVTVKVRWNMAGTIKQEATMIGLIRKN